MFLWCSWNMNQVVELYMLKQLKNLTFITHCKIGDEDLYFFVDRPTKYVCIMMQTHYVDMVQWCIMLAIWMHIANLKSTKTLLDHKFGY